MLSSFAEVLYVVSNLLPLLFFHLAIWVIFLKHSSSYAFPLLKVFQWPCGMKQGVRMTIWSLPFSFSLFPPCFIYLFTLQYCIGFAIHWHESAMGVHVFPILNPPAPPPSSSHPSGSSRCTSPEHPVPCIKPGLVIHFTYDNLHVSVPFSHIIPLLPSPTESKRLFYTSVSLLLSHIQGYCYYLSKFHIYALVYCIGVFLSGLLHSL